MGAFDYINSINETKKNMIRGSDSREAAEKMYDPFVTSRSLSYHEDCILLVNELNTRGLVDFNVSNIQHYEFYLYVLNKKKRFSKWTKSEKPTESIELIMKFYNYSQEKAEQVLPLFSQESIDNMKSKTREGGRLK